MLTAVMAVGQVDLSFNIKNAGIRVNGRFDEVQVEQKFNPQDLESSFFNVTIPVSSLNTSNKTRDKHLKKKKYFDLENYSEIKFTSEKVTKTQEGFSLQGSLTIKATTKEVVIPFSISEIENKTVLQGYLEVDRRDYGVGKNHLIMGDLVKINILVPYEGN